MLNLAVIFVYKCPWFHEWGETNLGCRLYIEFRTHSVYSFVYKIMSV